MFTEISTSTAHSSGDAVEWNISIFALVLFPKSKQTHTHTESTEYFWRVRVRVAANVHNDVITAAVVMRLARMMAGDGVGHRRCHCSLLHDMTNVKLQTSAEYFFFRCCSLWRFVHSHGDVVCSAFTMRLDYGVRNQPNVKSNIYASR